MFFGTSGSIRLFPPKKSFYGFNEGFSEIRTYSRACLPDYCAFAFVIPGLCEAVESNRAREEGLTFSVQTHFSKASRFEAESKRIIKMQFY
jgi:hypothetical protein